MLHEEDQMDERPQFGQHHWIKSSHSIAQRGVCERSTCGGFHTPQPDPILKFTQSEQISHEIVFTVHFKVVECLQVVQNAQPFVQRPRAGWFDDLGTLWNGDGTPIVQFQPHAQVEWRVGLEKGCPSSLHPNRPTLQELVLVEFEKGFSA